MHETTPSSLNITFEHSTSLKISEHFNFRKSQNDTTLVPSFIAHVIILDLVLLKNCLEKSCTNSTVATSPTVFDYLCYSQSLFLLTLIKIKHSNLLETKKNPFRITFTYAALIW